MSRLASFVLPTLVGLTITVGVFGLDPVVLVLAGLVKIAVGLFSAWLFALAVVSILGLVALGTLALAEFTVWIWRSLR